MHFSGKIISSLYQCCCLSLLLLCNVSLADPPAVAVSGYFGGSGDEQVNAVTTDADDNIYITGWTRSAGLPGSTAGATLNGGQDAFVSKLDAAGNVVFTRYIGAGVSSFEDREEGRAIAVDATGMIYITGTLAGNVHYSGTSGAYDNCDNGVADAFVAVLAADGGISYLSCFGGGAADYATDMVLNSDDSVTVVGYTSSTDFPVTNDGFQQNKGSNIYSPDAFILRLKPAGQGAADLQFASYLGGNGADKAAAVDVDTQGNLYIVGTTGSFNLSPDDTLLGVNDVFVARLNSTGAGTSGYGGPQYIRLFGAIDSGADCDSGADIVVDGQNERLYLTGRFESQGAVIGRIDATSGQLLATSFVAGSPDLYACDGSTTGITIGRTITLDGNGGGYIGGVTNADDLPAGVNGYHGDSSDGFITRFDADLNPLYTYYLGGSTTDAIYAIRRLDSALLYIAGMTDSADMPVTDSSLPEGGSDGLLAQMNPQVGLSLDAVSQIPVLIGGTRQVEITLRNNGPDAAHDISLELSPPLDYPGDISLVQGDCTLLTTSIMCTLTGVDVPPGAAIPLTLSVSNQQQGNWSFGYTLTSPAYEQSPADNQGDLPLSFVDRLPPTITVTDGSTGQAPAGGGGTPGYLIFLLCLLFLSRTYPGRLLACKPMK